MLIWAMHIIDSKFFYCWDRTKKLKNQNSTKMFLNDLFIHSETISSDVFNVFWWIFLKILLRLIPWPKYAAAVAICRTVVSLNKTKIKNHQKRIKFDDFKELFWSSKSYSSHRWNSRLMSMPTACVNHILTKCVAL